jgi:NitT/TauT family transport system permease protein
MGAATQVYAPPRPAAGARRRRRRARTTVALARLGVIGCLVGLWAVVATLTTSIPPVGTTLSALADGFRDGWITDPFWSTLRGSFGGLALAAVVGLPLGAALGRVTWLRSTLDPLVAGTFVVPRVVLYPALLGIFGIGLNAKLVMAALAAFFPILMITTAAVRDVPERLVRVGRAYGCTRWQLARKIFVPATAAPVIGALRLAFSVAFVNVIIAELFASDTGLGVIVSQAYGQQDLPRMFALVTLIFIVALVVNMVLWALERTLQSRV